MKVRDVMTSVVITVEPATTFKETAERLLDYGVSGLPVVAAGGRLVGLVTEADLMSKEAFASRTRRPLEAVVELLTGERRWVGKANGLTAGEIMTTDLVTARPDEDVRTAARRMLERGVKRLPVVEGDRLVGIVSRHDLLRVFHRRDADIAAEIETKLASPRYAPENHEVSFTVEDGVVTLEGKVDFKGEVAVVEGLASGVPGVVHVVNRVGFEVAETRR
jgi:CBS domain-containing protein